MRVLELCPILLLAVFRLTVGQDENGFAVCGDCHCTNGDDPCPTGDQVPQMEYSSEFVLYLRSLQLTNPFELSCDPYEDETCDTVPPLSDLTALGDAAACGVVYEAVPEGQCPVRYSLQSFASVAELESAGAVLTHHGACGVCSSLQDLAVYIANVNLVDAGTECSIRGIVGDLIVFPEVIPFVDGVQCYMQVGYTEVSCDSEEDLYCCKKFVRSHPSFPRLMNVK